MNQTKISGRVVSVLPGRVRLRIQPEQRHRLQRISTHLASQSGIRHVSVNDETGSVLVHCAHPAVSCDDILEMIRDVGVVVVRTEEAAESPPSSNSVREIVSAVGDLDWRLAKATGRNVDLRLVAPLVVGALGVRQVVVGGVSQASGLFLLWLAYEMYVRLNRSPKRATWQSRFATEVRTAPAVGAEGV